MPTRPSARRRSPVLIALCALVVGASTPVLAQSDRDLRDENQRLRTELADLRRELDAAQRRISELEKEIQRLMAGSPPVTQPPAPRVTIDESTPDASPRALFAALQESYAQTTRDLELGDPDTLDGRRRRATYMRAVESWINRVRREFKTPIKWTVRVIPMTHQEGQPGVLEVIAIDPQTEVELGDPFALRLDRVTRRRAGQLAQRGALDVLVVRGTLVPLVALNEDRKEPGAFDNPPLIGPYAEFGLTVEASSVTLPEEEKKQEERPRGSRGG